MLLQRSLGWPKTVLAFLCIFSAIHYAYMIQFDATAFVERSLISAKPGSKPRNFTSASTKISLRYVLMATSKGLSNIINVLSRYQEDPRNSTKLKVSYVGESSEKIMNEVFSGKGEKIHALETGDCSQVSSADFNVPLSCKKFKRRHLFAMKTLINTTLVKPVMVVTDEHELCAKYIEESMRQITSYEPHVQRVGGSHFLVKDLTDALYKAIFTLTRTIILISSDHVSELILARSKFFPDLTSSVIWVTFNSNIDTRIFESTRYNVVFESNDLEHANSLDWNGVMQLSVKRIASLSYQSKMLSKWDAASLSKQATSELKGICKMPRSAGSLGLVNFQRTDGHWLEMYRLTGDGKLTMLSNDAKISWLSRTNFLRAVLKVVTLLEPPFIMLMSHYYDKRTRSCSQGLLCTYTESVNNRTAKKETCCIGLMMDLLHRLQIDLSLSIDLYLVEDGLYGAPVQSGWNGMIGELVNGKADMIMAPLTATTKRSTVIDIGEPILHISFAIILLYQYEVNLPFLNFYTVQHIEGSLLWVLCILFTFGFFFIFLLENTLFCPKRESPTRHFRFKEGFSYVSGITFQRDLGGTNPKKSSARISFVVFAFGMVIVMSTYTANLTAVKVNKVDRNEIQGLEDPEFRNPSKQFRFGTIASSSLEEFFRFSYNLGFSNMHTFMKQYNTKHTGEGVKQVVNGKLQAFILEHPMAVYYASKQNNCSIRIIETRQGKGTWNAVFRRGSHWNRWISKKILEYKEKAILSGMYKKWMHSSCTKQAGTTAPNNKFTIKHFGGFIIILSISFLASFVILLFEHIFFRRKEHSRRYSLNPDL